MKTIIYNKEVNYYTSLEEAVKHVTEGQEERFLNTAKGYATNFLKECESTGVAQLAWHDTINGSYCGVDFDPVLLVDGVFMFARKNGQNYSFYDCNPVLSLSNDKFTYNKPCPNKVGKPTAKSLKAWAQYIKDKHEAEQAHKDEESQRRNNAIPQARQKLINGGFTPYFKSESAENANKFVCVRGGVKCVATIDNTGFTSLYYEVDYKTGYALFDDIK